jgi:parallel beta-helix repeat protein
VTTLTRIRRRYACALAAAAAALVLGFGASAGRAGGGTPISSCGQTVTTNAFLTQDLVCTGHGILVAAAGITIDLKGFAIRGDGGASDYGVAASNGFDKVTIKNGAVRNFDTGVYAVADDVRVSGVVASGNNDGIVVAGAAALVTSSTGSGNYGFGIYVQGAGGRIASSGAFGNAAGIRIDGANGRVTSSSASGNGDHGIVVVGDAAKLSGNRALGNGFGTGSDFSGYGVVAANYTTPPVGKNVALGNDAPGECSPASLC